MEITDSNFEKEVIEKSNQKLVIVDFWAPWCGPCQMLKPILEKLEEQYKGKFILAKMNVDENQEKPAEYGIMSIPAVKFFKNSEIVDEFIGAMPEERIRQIIDENLEN